MPLFVCEKCGCVENTALGNYWLAKERLCGECYTGSWHGRFPKRKATAEELANLGPSRLIGPSANLREDA